MAKHLIYLAAGNSKRFGSNKLLYPLNGRPLFQYVLDVLMQATALRPSCTLTVVSRYPQILETAQQVGARGVNSPDSYLGLSYTIRAALDALPSLTSEDFLLFFVADQPWLTLDTVLSMIDGATPGTMGGTAVWQDQVGSPTLFSASLAPRLRNLTGDQGGRMILRELGSACRTFSVRSPRELEDLDLPPLPPEEV